MASPYVAGLVERRRCDPALTPSQRALFYLKHHPLGLDSDAVKVTERYLKTPEARAAAVSPRGDPIVAAFDAYHLAEFAAPAAAALVSTVEALVTERFSLGVAGVGTPVVFHLAPRSPTRGGGGASSGALERGGPAASPSASVVGPEDGGAGGGGGGGDHSGRSEASPTVRVSGDGSVTGRSMPGMRPMLGTRRTSLSADGTHARLHGAARAGLATDLLSPAPGPYIPVTLVYYAPEMEALAREVASGPAASAGGCGMWRRLRLLCRRLACVCAAAAVQPGAVAGVASGCSRGGDCG